MKKYIITLGFFILIISFIQAEEKSECTLISKIKTIEEFELIGEKAEGSRFNGGVFREKSSGNLYLVKYSPLGDSIPEYISGEILSYILGSDRVGRYEYIWDQNENTYATGSPWLVNFEPLESIFEVFYEHLFTSGAVGELEELLNCFPRGCKIIEGNIIQKLEKGEPSIISGKSLIGFDEIIIASIFVNDQDFNPSNIGYVEKDDLLIGAKVDHGETLRQLDSVITLAEIRKRMCMLGYWKWELNFEETLFILKKIAELKDLDKIIEAAVEQISQYMDIIEWGRFLKLEKEGLCTIVDIKQYLKQSFKIRQIYFQHIAEGLEMEMAIKNNDLEGVKNLIERGVAYDIKIDSYFNWNAPTGFLIPSETSDSYILSSRAIELCQQEESITPLEYAKKLGVNEIVDYLEKCMLGVN